MESDNLTALLANLSPEKRVLLELRLKEKSRESLVVPSIPHTSARGSAPLSFAQQRLWFLNQLKPESATYNEANAIRLNGVLDIGAFKRALNQIVLRHEVLRTTIVTVDRDPRQVVVSNSDVDLPVIDLQATPKTDRDSEAQRLIAETIRKPFDLSRDLMLRVLLLQLAEQEHIFLVVKHHIASDGWSSGILWKELTALYEAFVSGEPSPLPELPIQYADYAVWQRDWLQGEVLERQLSYWKKQLAGLGALQLPTDRKRPAVQSFRGARQSFVLSKDLTNQLKALSREQGVTLFMTLLAAFQELLHRYTGQEDVAVGCPIAGRTRQEVEGLIGFFVNTLVMRINFSGTPTFRELLARVREVALGAYAHQDLPFEKLVEEMRPQRDLSRNPLFQVMFVLQNAPQHALKLPGLTLKPVGVGGGTATVDLTLEVQEIPQGLSGSFEYATDLFDEPTIARMATHWRTLLEAMAGTPERRVDELPLLTAAERHQLLVDLDRTNRNYPGNALTQDLFEAQVERTPGGTALKDGATVLSYAELDARANRMAQVLRSRGIGRGQRVGLCVERGADMLAAVLGILKAGAAYVPLDPDYPEDRLRFMAEDAQLTLLVSTTAPAGFFGLPRERQLLLDADARIIASALDTRLPIDADSAQPEDPAYVIYTSGSTGKPKGVVVPHRSVVNFLSSMAREPGLSADDVLIAVTTLSFDISVLELQLPLTLGATVVIASREEAVDGQVLGALLERHRATVMQATPVTWRLLLEAGWKGGKNFKALVGGEALPKDLADQLIADGVEWWNMYGPTETTVWSTCAHITDTATGISIGKPIANTTVYILDAQQNLCPIGVPGELCIGGGGVALGYWNRPELTAERFIPDPFSDTPGATLYRTGDRARWRNDGTLEYLGRLDDQVKVRGSRVELGEIEAVLAEHPAVGQAAVHLWTVKADDVRIVACCVPANAGALAPVSLRKHLRARLPEYMIPQYFLPVEEIPLTPNGKIDRSKLPVPVVTESPIGQHEAPSDPVEDTIAEIWTNLIGPARPIGRADKFFEMGGHSLLALQALRQIENKLGLRLEFRVLFQESLAEIATRCRSERVAGNGRYDGGMAAEG